MNKKGLVIYVMVVWFTFIIGFITYILLSINDYSNYMLVKTEQCCYKLNKSKKSKKADYNQFAHTNNKIYSISNCFESYIDRDKNEVLNKINQENYNLFLKSNNDPELLNIINEISNLKHDLFDVKIIYTENCNYFVSIYLNTNWICPSDLYIYDKNTKKLKLIFETYNELIIDINENNINI